MSEPLDRRPWALGPHDQIVAVVPELGQRILIWAFVRRGEPGPRCGEIVQRALHADDAGDLLVRGGQPTQLARSGQTLHEELRAAVVLAIGPERGGAS